MVGEELDVAVAVAAVAYAETDQVACTQGPDPLRFLDRAGKVLVAKPQR
jgi:hypothetical protein